jgi:hypothetical protein
MKETKKTFGMLIIIVAFLIFLYEKLTGSISTMLGHLYCGENYMKKVNGIIGDPSCGFNIDMYLSASLILLFIVGIGLFISSDPKKEN